MKPLKNRFVVIQVDYIDGDILKDVIKQQSQLQDDAIIEQIISSAREEYTS